MFVLLLELVPFRIHNRVSVSNCIVSSLPYVIGTLYLAFISDYIEYFLLVGMCCMVFGAIGIIFLPDSP